MVTLIVLFTTAQCALHIGTRHSPLFGLLDSFGSWQKPDMPSVSRMRDFCCRGISCNEDTLVRFRCIVPALFLERSCDKPLEEGGSAFDRP